jgi:uncharacterized repeat protein (TIGR01451 family)
VTPISIGQTVNGQLTTSDGRSPIRESSYCDRYTFNATAGQQVAILLTSSAFDTYLYLIDSSGRVVAEDDDGGGGWNSRIPRGSGYFTLPSSGTYTIEVTSYYSNHTGSYTLSVRGPTASTPPSSQTCDMGITMGASPNPVNANGRLTYTLEVRNHGTGPCQGVRIIGTPPPGATNIMAPGCHISGNTVTCNLGTVAAGSSATLTISVNAPTTTGTITSQARVEATSDVNPANNSATATTQVVAAPREERKVIFIQGINSESGFCGQSFRSRVHWMVDYLVNTPWVRERAPSLDSPQDFLYFSYSGRYCRGDLRLPSYTQSHTCLGVADAASKLDTMVRTAVRTFGPNTKFDIIAHSMGGMVAAYWLATTTPEMRARVHSVVTFDSPLRGVPAPSPIIALVIRACGMSAQSLRDLSCVSIQGNCPIVSAIANIGRDVRDVPFYTIDAIAPDGVFEFVPGDRTMLLNSESKLHCRFWDTHSGVWENEQLRSSLNNELLGFSAPAPAVCESSGISPETAFTIWQPIGNEKQIFVGCAVAGLSAQECKEKLLEAFSG